MWPDNCCCKAVPLGSVPSTVLSECSNACDGCEFESRPLTDAAALQVFLSGRVLSQTGSVSIKTGLFWVGDWEEEEVGTQTLADLAGGMPRCSVSLRPHVPNVSVEAMRCADVRAPKRSPVAAKPASWDELQHIEASGSLRFCHGMCLGTASRGRRSTQSSTRVARSRGQSREPKWHGVRSAPELRLLKGRSESCTILIACLFCSKLS
eukprot:6198084-Pleurochrysis_carterae.AAC.11